MIRNFFDDPCLFIVQDDTDGTEIFTPGDPDNPTPEMWLPFMT
jgi:hypothetical protein